ncbi:MAG TPA: TspO/MBR family protein [Candidatus Eisenbacteria bacterium]|jgi:tryptophan-rich sensory protein|nr:TspO/MBR family protein [Candidatus Eisenbacteria bacterium]
MADSTAAWYQQLAKPSWAPPSWLFGPVWTVLYAGIAVTFGTVFYFAAKGRIPALVALPFVLNLVFNFAFTPLQFGLRSNVLAAVDILLVLGTLVWAILAVRPFAPWIAWAQTPYLLWVMFATVLQLSVTWMNR